METAARPVAPHDYSDFVAALAGVNAQPLWDRFKTLITREPVAPDAPYVWTWDAMLPMIERALKEVQMEDVERRVLLLANPAFGGQVKTTTNLNGALQILGGGEHAHAHRHRLSAVRMVLEGSTAETIVDGKRCTMLPGDLILTPAMSWHAHVNHGDERVVWFDGLDLPLALFDMGVVCFEPGPETPGAVDFGAQPDSAFSGGGILPVGVAPQGRSPLLRYPWESVRAAFEAMSPGIDGSKLLRYTDPVGGGAVIPTLDCYAQEIAAGQPTVARRSTHNAIVVVVEGEGESQVGSQTLRWRKNDIFTLPHWNWIAHRSDRGARLFLMTDRELLHRMGYLADEVQGGVAPAA